jgi:hypothetical protein
MGEIDLQLLLLVSVFVSAFLDGFVVLGSLPFPFLQLERVEEALVDIELNEKKSQ